SVASGEARRGGSRPTDRRCDHPGRHGDIIGMAFPLMGRFFCPSAFRACPFGIRGAVHGWCRCCRLRSGTPSTSAEPGPRDGASREPVNRWLWKQDSGPAWIARLGLTPASWGVEIVTSSRIAAYRHGWLRRQALPLPTISVGNLTVGGTGKTPLASWIAAWFVARRFRPAVL